MYFVLQTPSLQRITLIKIIAGVWNDMWNRHVLTRAAQSPNGLRVTTLTEGGTEWEEVKKKVKDKISALPLPPPCKEQLFNLVEPLGFQMSKWCVYHCGAMMHYHFLENMLPRQFCWSMHGVLNYAKTAELMVKNERLGMEKRFELACLNCLVEEAGELFERMPEDQMREYVNSLIDGIGIELFQLIVFFIRTLNVDRHCLKRCFPSSIFSEEPSIKNDLFQDTLCSGNRRMCEYVFNRFNQRQKDKILADCRRLVFVCRERPTCNLLYYLSLMNEEQQRRMFRECNSDLLECLLHWPLQSLFMEAVKLRWQFMNNRACCDVLFSIIGKMRFHFQDYDYCQLFWEFWRLSSTARKQFYFENFWILQYLFFTEREEFIQLLLNEANSQQMETFFDKIGEVLMNEMEISDATLMECKNCVESISLNYDEDAERRLRSQRLSRLIDMEMKSRIKRRE